MSPHEAIRVAEGKGLDLVEVSPPFDGPGQITSLLAANLLFEMLCVIARNAR
jgi:arginase family enzyme